MAAASNGDLMEIDGGFGSDGDHPVRGSKSLVRLAGLQERAGPTRCSYHRAVFIAQIERGQSVADGHENQEKQLNSMRRFPEKSEFVPCTHWKSLKNPAYAEIFVRQSSLPLLGELGFSVRHYVANDQATAAPLKWGV